MTNQFRAFLELLRASPTIIAKVAFEKVQFSALSIVFSILFPTDSLLYYLLAFKYYLSFFFHSFFIIFTNIL